MALKKIYTPEELGLTPTQEEATPKKREFTPAELGLTSIAQEPKQADKKEFTPQELGLTPAPQPEPTKKEAEPGILGRTAETLFRDTPLSATQGILETVRGLAAPLREMAGKEQEFSAKLVEKVTGKPAPKAKEPAVSDQDLQDAIAKVRSLKSEGTKLAEEKLSETKGALNTIATYLKNPSLISTGTAEMLAPMIAGGGLGRMFGKYGMPFNYAAGEGVIAGAMSAQQVRDAQDGAPLTPEQSILVAENMALTTAFSALGGRVANKLGLDDIDEILAGKAAGQLSQKAQSKLVAATKSAIVEGGIEELPQSVADQITQNLATGKPWDEGVAESAASGLVLGSVPGFGAGFYTQANINKRLVSEALAKQQEEKMIVPGEEKLGRADTIKQVWGRIESAAKELEAKKAKESPVVEAAPTPVAPSEPGILDAATLKTFGINPKSNAYKGLLDTDITTPEGQRFLEDVLDKYGGKVNYDAVNEYLQTVPKEEPVIKEVPTYEEQASADVRTEDSGSKALRQRARASLGMPPERLGTEIQETTEPTTGGLGDISRLAEQRVGDVGRSEAVEPSALEEEKFVPNEAWLARAKEAEDNFDTVKARYDKVASNAKSTQKQIDKATTELEAAIKQLRIAQVAENPPIEEAPAEEREAPPGFEWYKETTEDGRVQEGLRRIQEPIEEVTPVEEAPVEEAPVEEVAAEEVTPPELTEEDLADLDLRKRGKTLAGQLRALDPYHPLIPDLVSADVDEATLEAARATLDEESAARAARKPITPEEEAAALTADEETEAQVDALMETLNQAKDTIARGLEQTLGTKASITPEDRVSLREVLAAVADLMYVYIKQGIKSMGEAIRKARKDIGANAKGISRVQMENAYRAAEARVASEKRARKPGSKKDYEDQYKKTGLNQKQTKKESEFDRFKSSPVESVTRIADRVRSYLFSFDFAFNEKVKRAMRKAGVTPETLAKAFYELQVSQAVRADSMADLFLEKGSIAFDPELVKFVVQESASSMKAVRDSLSALAKQYGVPEEDFRKYASAAFIAQRSKGLVKANSKLQQQVLELTAKGEKDKAKKLLNKRYKLVHMSNSEIKNGLEFFKDFPELQNVFETWNDVREKTLNFAQQQGLYTKETVAELLDVMDYVPFYRIEQIEAQAGPKQYTRGLLDTLQDKAFKGSHKDVNDIFDNMERWTRYMIKKSMNNAVAQQKIKWYKAYLPDDIRPIPRSVRSETGNTISIWKDGKLQRYEFQGVDGETMVKAFTGLEPVVLNGAGTFLNMLRKSANFQRLAIVTNPIFSILQVPMDLATAMFTSGVRSWYMLPLQVMKEIPASILGMSEARKTLRETGTVGRNDFYREYSAFDVAAQQEVKQMKKLDKILKAVVSPLHALSVASDNVVRQAVYNQILLETKDKARAANAAEEVINFRRTGYSGVITIFRQITPFVNANLQALHVSLGTLIGSGINNDTRAEAFKRVMATGAQIAAVSFLYAAMKSGDDDYEKLDPAERDRFFVINDTFKIPMRNDIFTVLFKVIPEHTYNYLIAQSEDGAKMRLAFKNNLKRALAVPSPIPTLLTPMIEAGFNIDTVNNRPLLGAGQEGIEAEYQFSTKYTTEFAKMLGENSGVSPIVIDNFIRDWTGTVGVIATTAMNEYIAEKRGVILPEKTLKETLLQYPFFGQMLVKDVGSRNIADFYELKQEINRVVNTYNRLNAYDFDKAKEYLYTDKNRDRYNLRTSIDAIQKEISNMRKYERYVRENKQGRFADPEEKAAELRRIDKHIQDMLGAQNEFNGRLERLVQTRRIQAGM